MKAIKLLIILGCIYEGFSVCSVSVVFGVFVMGVCSLAFVLTCLGFGDKPEIKS